MERQTYIERDRGQRDRQIEVIKKNVSVNISNYIYYMYKFTN